MEEDPIPTEVAAAVEQGHPPSGTERQSGSAKEEIDRKITAEHFNLVPPAAPLQPISFAIPSTGQTAPASRSELDPNNPYDILAQQGSGAADKTVTDLASDQHPGLTQQHRDPGGAEGGTPYL